MIIYQDMVVKVQDSSIYDQENMLWEMIRIKSGSFLKSNQFPSYKAKKASSSLLIGKDSV
jgi:hypothetical protein